MEFKIRLKLLGITKIKLAHKIGVTRPTLDLLIRKYEAGEPIKEYYRETFDSIMKGTFMEGKYRCLNNNIVVRIVDDTAVNSNGTRVAGTETRSKRDIVVGEIIACANTNIKRNAKVFFSLYAAQPITLEGEQLYVVNFHDIKLIKEN